MKSPHKREISENKRSPAPLENFTFESFALPSAVISALSIPRSGRVAFRSVETALAVPLQDRMRCWMFPAQREWTFALSFPTPGGRCSAAAAPSATQSPLESHHPAAFPLRTGGGRGGPPSSLDAKVVPVRFVRCGGIPLPLFPSASICCAHSVACRFARKWLKRKGNTSNIDSQGCPAPIRRAWSSISPESRSIPLATN